MFSVAFAVQARCLRCHRDRDYRGSDLIASGQKTWVVKAEEPCPCGEQRLKLTFTVDVEDETPQAR